MSPVPAPEPVTPAGGGVTPSTVYEALLPLGKIGVSPGFLGDSCLYDPDRVLGAADTGVLAVYWPAVGGLKLGGYVGDLSHDDAVIAEMQGITETYANFTMYEWNVGAAEAKLEVQGGSDAAAHASLLIRPTTGQILPVIQTGDDDGVAAFRVMETGSIGVFGKTPPAQSAAGTTAADAIACLKAFGFMAP